MGITELIARDRDDYLAIAARLVAESAWRRDLAARIRAAHGRLFNVSDGIERLQALLQVEALQSR